MDGGLGEMSLHGHPDLAHSQDGRAMLHSRDLSAAFPRPSLGGPSMSLEPEPRPPGFDHSMSALGYSGDSPSSSGSTYTTLTPLQPFDDKFHHHHHHHHPCLPVSNVIGSFTLMREDRGLGTNFYNPYGKDLAMSQSLSPPSTGSGLTSSMHGYGSLGNSPNGNGGQMLHAGYDVHGGSLFCRTSDFGREMSPPGLGAGDVSVGHQLNKMEAHQHAPGHHPHIYGQHYQPHHHPSQQASKMGEHLHSSSSALSSPGDGMLPGSQGGGGGEEINTRDVAQRIITELKRYSIPQAIFAERVLCRSQGTLSDLLRNPKPWGKLKSGRETFKRMSRWLQEPEFQRMASLRLEGKTWLCSLSASRTHTHTHTHTRRETTNRHTLSPCFPQTPSFSMSSKHKHAQKFFCPAISMQLRVRHEEKQKHHTDVSSSSRRCERATGSSIVSNSLDNGNLAAH
uniref:One cut domain, family member, like n=1 Tax=Gasterosteus aculeatus aculeatus TaxID=481459 RepID=A0AAQ4P9K6_GASAC